MIHKIVKTNNSMITKMEVIINGTIELIKEKTMK